MPKPPFHREHQDSFCFTEPKYGKFAFSPSLIVSALQRPALISAPCGSLRTDQVSKR